MKTFLNVCQWDSCSCPLLSVTETENVSSLSPDTCLSTLLPSNPSIWHLPPSPFSPGCHWRYRPVMWPTRQTQSPSIHGCLLATWIQRWSRSLMLRASFPSMAVCSAVLCTRAMPLSSTPVRGMPGELWLGRTAGCWQDKHSVSWCETACEL